ncbi:hypothetical protein EYF80_021674 [Liparis tanakae]|uniref:Uncharacterized protein n=1 Tax=Liparis tanakae TaxID=230148 RepID=A0A4Z2HQB3_9TELE|nr:hypothetical protein EYF80_021674 [Liparis tanakae]
MGRYTVDCVPFNPHDTLPDARWLSDRHTASTDIVTHGNTKSHYRGGGTHEAIPGATYTHSPRNSVGVGQDAERPQGNECRASEDRPASGPRDVAGERRLWFLEMASKPPHMTPVCRGRLEEGLKGASPPYAGRAVI